MKDVAERYEKEAAQLLEQNKFLEASSKFKLASKEWDDAGNPKKAKQELAQGFFFEGLGTYLQANFSGHFAQDDVRIAFNSFENASKIFGEIGNEKGAQGTTGWKYFMNGILEESSGKPDLAEQSYRKARIAFREMRDYSSVVQDALRAVESQLLQAILAQIFLDPTSFAQKKGQAYQLVDELAEKNPDDAAFYKAQLLVFKALDAFFQGQEDLRDWEYRDAEKLFQAAGSELVNLKLETRIEKTQKQMTTMVDAYKVLNQAGLFEAKALKLFLEKSDFKQATEKMREAAETYDQAEEAFAKAHWTTPAGLDKFSKMNKRRASVLAEMSSKSLKQVTVGVGKWFVLFTFVTLGILLLANPYLKVNGAEILNYSLTCGIIGGFGLKSAAILGAVHGAQKQSAGDA